MLIVPRYTPHSTSTSEQLASPRLCSDDNQHVHVEQSQTRALLHVQHDRPDNLLFNW